MKVTINEVESPGEIEKEKVILKVLEDINIGDYVVMDHTFNPVGDLTDTGRHAYKFPSKGIKKGDLVCLYTRAKPVSGWVDEKEINEGKNKCYFFYWNRGNTVWNKNGKDTCTLMEVHDTKVVKVKSES